MNDNKRKSDSRQSQKTVFNLIRNSKSADTKLPDTFAPIPNWLLRRKELPHLTKLVYGRLLQYRGKGSIANPRRKVLAEELGFSTYQVDRYLAVLRDWKLIRIQRMGLRRANRYHFLPNPWKVPFTDEFANSRTQEFAQMPTQELAKLPTPLKRTSGKEKTYVCGTNSNGRGVIRLVK